MEFNNIRFKAFHKSDELPLQKITINNEEILGYWAVGYPAKNVLLERFPLNSEHPASISEIAIIYKVKTRGNSITNVFGSRGIIESTLCMMSPYIDVLGNPVYEHDIDHKTGAEVILGEYGDESGTHYGWHLQHPDGHWSLIVDRETILGTDSFNTENIQYPDEYDSWNEETRRNFRYVGIIQEVRRGDKVEFRKCTTSKT